MPELVTIAAGRVLDLRREAAAGRLYAVLDGCDEPRVRAKAAELGADRGASLYRGAAEDDLAAIAPYLVLALPPVIEWLTSTLWTAPWGIFAIADADFDTMRTHFRRFLLVDAPDGGKWYFRFYDPRVLARFLPTCDAAQLSEFFGPVASFEWTDPDTYGITIARRAWFEGVPARPRVTLRRA